MIVLKQNRSIEPSDISRIKSYVSGLKYQANNSRVVFVRYFLSRGVVFDFPPACDHGSCISRSIDKGVSTEPRCTGWPYEYVYEFHVTHMMLVRPFGQESPEGLSLESE